MAEKERGVTPSAGPEETRLALRLEGIVPIGEIGLSPLEKYVGLTAALREETFRFAQIMSSGDTGEMAGIGSVEYLIHPGKVPVVERHVHPDRSLYLDIEIIPGPKPGTGRVRLRWDVVGLLGHNRIDATLLHLYFLNQGCFFELEDLQEFVRRAFPGRRCEIRGWAPYKDFPPWSRDFLKIKRESFDKFFWKRVFKKTPAKEKLRHVLSYDWWQLYLERQEIPLLFFALDCARVQVGVEGEREDPWKIEARILCAVPHVFFEGSASEAEQMLRLFNDFLEARWVPGKISKPRARTIFNRWYDGEEPVPG